ncbi:hypothetical protein VP01_2352g3 [Puccinia sorghi]|uniref:Uncharacterized protein n=1 Tax=Puccinia sorghi TaxID=27349 RepID=A0A0L6V958_9BASI|nr:hypothetical protein VP01_2352g3 [Puccinia sorghi]
MELRKKDTQSPTETVFLSTTLDAEWELRSTFARVATRNLLYNLYKHCGYDVPEGPHQE